jgi:hypothetical protein
MVKRLVLGFLVTTASVVGFTLAAAEPAAADMCYPNWTYRATSNGVNVRTGPGTSYGRVYRLIRSEALCGPGPRFHVRTNDGTTGCPSGVWAPVYVYGRLRYVCTSYVYRNI